MNTTRYVLIFLVAAGAMFVYLWRVSKSVEVLTVPHGFEWSAPTPWLLPSRWSGVNLNRSPHYPPGLAGSPSLGAASASWALWEAYATASPYSPGVVEHFSRGNATSQHRARRGAVPPVPHPSCGAWVSAPHRLVVVGARGSGVERLVQGLGLCRRGAPWTPVGLRAWAGIGALRFDGGPVAEADARVWNGTSASRAAHACLVPLDATLASEEDLLDLWSSWTILTVTRNPLRRFAAAHRRVGAVRERAGACLVTWDRMCEFPTSLAAQCQRNSECCVDVQSALPIHAHAALSWALPQSQCVLDSLGRPAVDLVVRSEFFEADAAVAMRAADARRRSAAARRARALAEGPPGGRRRLRPARREAGQTDTSLSGFLSSLERDLLDKHAAATGWAAKDLILDSLPPESAPSLSQHWTRLRAGREEEGRARTERISRAAVASVDDPSGEGAAAARRAECLAEMDGAGAWDEVLDAGEEMFGVECGTEAGLVEEVVVASARQGQANASAPLRRRAAWDRGQVGLREILGPLPVGGQLREYYSGRHAHCMEAALAFYAADARLQWADGARRRRRGG